MKLTPKEAKQLKPTKNIIGLLLGCLESITKTIIAAIEYTNYKTTFPRMWEAQGGDKIVIEGLGVAIKTLEICRENVEGLLEETPVAGEKL